MLNQYHHENFSFDKSSLENYSKGFFFLSLLISFLFS
nr:MAG TPA: hypothetical protein [Caudoviricetes sp.]